MQTTAPYCRTVLGEPEMTQRGDKLSGGCCRHVKQVLGEVQKETGRTAIAEKSATQGRASGHLGLWGTGKKGKSNGRRKRLPPPRGVGHNREDRDRGIKQRMRIKR